MAFITLQRSIGFLHFVAFSISNQRATTAALISCSRSLTCAFLRRCCLCRSDGGRGRLDIVMSRSLSNASLLSSMSLGGPGRGRDSSLTSALLESKAAASVHATHSRAQTGIPQRVERPGGELGVVYEEDVPQAPGVSSAALAVPGMSHEEKLCARQNAMFKVNSWGGYSISASATPPSQGDVRPGTGSRPRTSTIPKLWSVDAAELGSSANA